MKIKRAELLLRVEAVGLALLMLLQLAGCNAPREESTGLDHYNAKWERLADGSHYASVENVEDGFALSMRCWPDSKVVFRCIRVIESSSTGFNVRQIDREDVPELPRWMLPFVPVTDGYGCGTVVGPTERISRDGDTLVSNDLTSISARWSQSYVDRYISKNKVKGQRWFPCVKVLRAVLDGSLETLSTTSITKKDLGQN